MSNGTTKEVVKLDTAICICSQKATTILVRMESFSILHAKTTWICPNCSAANLNNTNTKIKVANSDSVKPSTCNSVGTPNNGNLIILFYFVNIFYTAP